MRVEATAAVTDAGYFAKRITEKPDWLKADGVVEVCSVSHCIAQAPDGWVQLWRHNELGWFDQPSDALLAVPADQRQAFRLYAYRVHPEVFRPEGRSAFSMPPLHVDPIPSSFRSLGFDCASKSTPLALGFECSPLSCNSMATELGTNACCLFDSLDEAIAGAARFSAEQPEPGDYYVVEVLTEAMMRLSGGLAPASARILKW